MKTLMTVLISSARLKPVAIVTLSLHVILRTAIVCLTLILIICFVTQSASASISKDVRKSA